MGNFTSMEFNPEGGLTNPQYDTTPASETEARAQAQAPLDQLKKGLNGLIDELEKGETGTSGAERIGSAAINGVSGSTPYEQIFDLKTQLDTVVSGGLTDNIVENSHLSDNCVSGTEIADVSIDSEHYVVGSIDLEHLAADSVNGTKIVDNSIDSEHIADDAIEGSKIFDLAVTETKINTGAVTNSKLRDGAVISSKIGSGAVTNAKIGSGAVTNVKIGSGAVSEAKLANDAVTTNKLGIVSRIELGANDKLEYDEANNFLTLVTDSQTPRKIPTIIVSTSNPSGTYPDGTLWIKY